MKEKKEIINIIYNILYKMLNVLFPLISAGIIARRLLPYGVGKVSTAQNIVTYFTFLAPMGLPIYGVREIAKAKGKELDKLFSECLIINAISTSLCIIVYYNMIRVVPYFKGEKLLYIVAGLSIIFNYMNIEWFYQGKGEYKYIAVRSMAVKMMMFLAIIIFVKNPNDYIRYSFIYCIATGGNYLFNMLHLRTYSIKLQLNNLELLKHIRPLFILLASNIAVELYSLVDTTMLSFLCDENTVAYYTNSMKIVKVAVFVIAAIGGTTLQRISPLIQEKEYNKVMNIFSDIVKFMLILAIPCMLGLVVTAPNVIWVLYGKHYMKAVTTIRILSGLFLVLPFSNFIGTQILVAFNKESKVLFSQVIAAITNIFLNIILINMFKQNGAAIASVISEFVVLGMMVFFTKKEIKCMIGRKFLLQIFIASMVMLMVICFIIEVASSYIGGLILAIVIGICVYFVVLIIERNEYALVISNRIKCWLSNK